MKIVYLVLSSALLLGFNSACNGSKESYVDLRTGQEVELQRDELTGVMVNKATGEPVYMYINTKTRDTIYGKTGQVVNGHVVWSDDKYWFDGDEAISIGNNREIDYKNGDNTTKVDEDGDVKIKTGDKKIKIDGETGEKKVKND